MSEIIRLYQLLHSGAEIEVELMFPNLSFRRGKDGPIHRISFEAQEDFWTAVKYLPANLRFRVKLQVIPDDEGASGKSKGAVSPESPQDADTHAVEPGEGEKPSLASPDVNGGTPAKRKAKPEKGPYGLFWKEICRLKFFSNLTLQEWLEGNGPWLEDVANNQDEQIRQIFGVPSRTFIAPWHLLDRLKQDLPKAAYDGLEVTITRAAERAGQPIQQERMKQ